MNLANRPSLVRRETLRQNPIERGMVNLHAALVHHFLQLAVADRISRVPADAPQDHLPLEMATLELDHRLPSPEPVAADHTSSPAQAKVCDRTPFRDQRICWDLFIRRLTRKLAVPSVIAVPTLSPARCRSA